jgi:hypothetical protein
MANKEQLREAYALIKQGNRTEAKGILTAYVRENPSEYMGVVAVGKQP